MTMTFRGVCASVPAVGRCAAVLAMMLATAAGAADEPRDPAWTCVLPGDLTWAASAGAADALTLLVALDDGSLVTIRPRDGHLNGVPLVQSMRGLRLAEVGPSRSAAQGCVLPTVVFDRHAIVALDPAASPAQRWRYTRGPASPQDFPGDPEDLPGWLAVLVTPGGVLAVNRDGHVALLDNATGDARWTTRIAAPASVTLAELDGHATLLWSSDKAAFAAFFDLADPAKTYVERRVGDYLPLWSGLAREGLVLVNALSARVWQPAGEPREIVLELLAMRAGNVALVPPQAGDDRGTLLLASDEALNFAFDLASGKRRWPRERLLAGGAEIERLVVCGGAFATWSDFGLAVHDVATGRPRAQAFTLDAALLDLELRPRVAHALLNLGAADAPRMAVLAFPYSLEHDEAPVEAAPLALRDAPGSRAVVWLPERVILADARRVCAYDLPPVPAAATQPAAAGTPATAPASRAGAAP